MSVDHLKLQHAGELILEAIGANPADPDLRDTPKRYAALWRDFINHIEGKLDTTFATEQKIDQMVLVSGLRVHSFCKHHLLPFWADIAIAYITETKMLGLSKFGRIARQHAHKLQVQEQLVTDIADHVQRVTAATSVAVIAKGEHSCMTMRGAQMPHRMTSSVTRGLFRSDVAARAELFALLAHATAPMHQP